MLEFNYLQGGKKGASTAQHVLNDRTNKYKMYNLGIARQINASGYSKAVP